MKIFVTGATGFQGSNIAKALLVANHQVVTIKRDTSKGAPPISGIQVLVGDLENKDALTDAMKGADAAVYSFPLIFDLAVAKQITTNFINAAKENGVGLVVYNPTFHLPKTETGLLAIDIKVAIKELFDASDLKVITVMPDVYIDNLSAPWSIPVVVNNKILPYPIAAGKKIPWVSHADLGKYVAKAIERPELAGQILPIGGNLLSGEEIAKAISQKNKEKISFVSVPVDEFEKQLTPGFGALAAKEISNIYRYVAAHYQDFTSKDFEKTNSLLSITPQTLNDWVDSVEWRA